MRGTDEDNVFAQGVFARLGETAEGKLFTYTVRGKPTETTEELDFAQAVSEFCLPISEENQ